MGDPSIPFVNFTILSCSRMPANKTNANEPTAVARGKNSTGQQSCSAFERFVIAFVLPKWLPKIQQLVVMSGKNTPSA